ncbi:1,2-phenylacetyl-CoA epoxidase subunit PaaC [Fluviicola taffensis]|uniref:1,2-phenylacetyl-CoA epoxidase subunit PaaC n=1 Tax=Fluviicola taffensis TaxID=191579 RepID=UPI003137BD6F
MKNNLFTYTLRIADDSLILGQRLAEWCGHGPIIEEDIALSNIALDLIGQATNLLEYAATVENKGRSADDLAFLRFENQYFNTQLVEQKNGDFAVTMVRQWIFDTFRLPFYEALQRSSDSQLAAIAEKSLKETKYHWKHSSEWIIRMGDGTEESNKRVNDALILLWKFSDELFFMDDVDQDLIAQGIAIDLETLRPIFNERIQLVLQQATLQLPDSKWKLNGGRLGRHTEHFGHLIAEMQYMQRAYPNMEW